MAFRIYKALTPPKDLCQVHNEQALSNPSNGQ